MILSWGIRYLDRSDKQIKDRCLFLDTETLDPVTKAAIELLLDIKTPSAERRIVQYRRLFVEDSAESICNRLEGTGDGFMSVGPSEYFEDEFGAEITLNEIACVITGNPSARLIPSGAQQHDIDYMLTEKLLVPMVAVKISSEDVRLLAYFSRDFDELSTSAFMQDGPGTIHLQGGKCADDGDSVLQTAVTHDEIGAFVTIFRRLYMDSEPANFHKAVHVFTELLGDHPLAKWVDGTETSYERKLGRPPDFMTLREDRAECVFDRKRLIDVFIYTRYAHQPNDRRQRQYAECLNEVQGQKDMLTWLFLTSMWDVSLVIRNAGRIIVRWFKRYCDHHNVAAEIVASLHLDSPGIGSQEKESVRRKRLFREKSEDLATELWRQRHRPDGGPMQFLQEAQSELRRSLGDD